MRFKPPLPARCTRRRIVFGALGIAGSSALVGPVAFAQGAARLPQRNLLVELRHGDESSFAATGAGLQSGSVTRGADGEVAVRAGVSVESRSRDASADAVTQLRVLNGAQGVISVGASVPIAWQDVVWTPSGPAVLAGQRLVDTGRRVAVRPRWPGGNEPVAVEVRTEASVLAGGGLPSRYQPDGQPQPAGSVETAGLLTTVQLPLGVWVTVASEATSERRQDRGLIARTEHSSDRRQVVQMRVTVP